MNIIRVVLPLLLIVVSIIFFINTLNTSTGNINNPMIPLYFPLISGSGLFVLSIVLLIQELQNKTKRNEESFQLIDKRNLYIAFVIIALSIGYTLIFDLLGFLLSTIFFLGIILFFLNGREKWILNISVTLISSSTLWFTLGKLLNLNLP